MYETAYIEGGARFADVLRQIYAGPSRVKQIMRDWLVSQATAERWLGGHLPGPKHWVAMCRRWGPRFAALLAVPERDWDEIESRLVAVEASVYERRANAES